MGSADRERRGEHELGVGASQLSSLLTIETRCVPACVFVGVFACGLPPANTRVKHKAIQLSTWPKGEGSTREGGIDR